MILFWIRNYLLLNYKQQSEWYDTNYENTPLAAEPESMYGQDNDS